MTTQATFTRLSFNQLNGWAADDHRAAFAAFLHSARYLATHHLKTRQLGFSAKDLRAAAAAALDLPDPVDEVASRQFFEHWFSPVLVERPGGGNGFLTGYYEPVHQASRAKTDRFGVPILRRPADLVNVTASNKPAQWDETYRFARQRSDGGLEIFPDRRDINAGALDHQGLELAYLESPVDAFFIHIQGSARLEFDDGTFMRIAYDGKSGHPYTAIGKVLLDEGALQPGNVTMQTLRGWLTDHPDQVGRVLQQNRSYIFFAETENNDTTLGPVAAGHVPLTPGRSLAIDRELMTFHLPIWIEGELPLSDPDQAEPVHRLMIAQDTGSAILGSNRADFFTGSGAQAGAVAGNIQHSCRFVVLAPREAAA